MRLVFVAFLSVALLQACSEQAKPTIVGHWRAENFRVQGLGLPLGPELKISDKELAVIGTDLRVPVQRIEVRGSEVTLSFPLNLSLSFHFESADRIYVDLPLVGPIYYSKVSTVVAARPAGPPPAPSHQVASPPTTPMIAAQSALAPVDTTADSPARRLTTTPANEPLGDPRDALVRVSQLNIAKGNLDEAEQALAQAAALDANYPPMMVEQAALAAAKRDADTALRHLHGALRAGFRPVSALDADPRLAALRDDSRFKAMTAGYR